MRLRKEEMQRIFNFDIEYTDARIIQLMKSIFVAVIFALMGLAIPVTMWLWCK